MEKVKTVNPANGSVVVERERPTSDEIEATIKAAFEAQKKWKVVSIEERVAIATKFVETMESQKEEIGKEISLQMGRPVSQTAGEMAGMAQRARHMISIAKEELSDTIVEDSPTFRRFIKKIPAGIVFLITPWNYPLLTVINSLIPAILSGNAVILSPSPQTPLTGERFASAFKAANLPDHILTVLHTSPEQSLKIAARDEIKAVSFTGSTVNGHKFAKAAAEGFKGITLELGGKDPAYVHSNAELDYAAETLVDGAMFNSGQCCCGIERIYVHESVYPQFLEKVEKITRGYRLGDPSDPSTNIGPVVSLQGAEKIREQIAEALSKGAKSLVEESLFPLAKAGTTYVAPTILVNVTHDMKVMTEETFGPVVGIVSVKSEKEALELMNDSVYGLTSSLWIDAAKSQDIIDYFVEELETGTVFVNRCDYCDPALAWTGRKDTGHGASLGKFGFEAFTQPKSIHIKIKTA